MYERRAWVLLFGVGLVLFAVGVWEFLVGPLDPTPGFSAPPAFFRAHLFFLVAFGLIVMALAWVPYRRWEPWAWALLWLVPAVMVGDTLMNRSAGGTLWPSQLALALVAAAGLLLPARRFLGRSGR